VPGTTGRRGIRRRPCLPVRPAGGGDRGVVDRWRASGDRRVL